MQPIDQRVYFNITRFVLLQVAVIALWLSTSVIAQEGDTKSYQDVDTQMLQRIIVENDDLMLIDIRTPDELATLGGTIDAGFRSYNVNRGWLEFRIEDFVPDKDTPVVLFCGISARSPLAAQTLTEMGYTNVYNYSDGFFKWRDAGLPVRLSDQNPGSMLFSKPVEVASGIWSAIGATAPPNYENSGHNNNLSFIITSEGVVVINAGANYLLAQALHNEIKKLTAQPIKFVSLENGQGHAMLGSNYWKEQGAVVVAHKDTDIEIDANGHTSLQRMQNRQRDKAMGTKLTRPDITFEDKHIIELGGERIELLNLGPAHSPGDIVAWLPKRKLVITGDIAFHQRLLPVFEYTDTKAWIETWDSLVELKAEIVVPGHGEATTMEEVTKYTYDYLKHLRKGVSTLLDEDGTLEDAYDIDQSAYNHLDTFDDLAKINAGRVFEAMEFE
ncbi:MAG: glyoxylase-like metal-dependent hydrolase (beta-lactamase superfamily II) [Flavobacteriales bacterium]|jgi:glyoxylase-like metal-dependent hydrolase (beta-lactamase superfamily II)/rhodanese-related sulfurtransferase